jgi:hypothetical protein
MGSGCGFSSSIQAISAILGGSIREEESMLPAGQTHEISRLKPALSRKTAFARSERQWRALINL